MVHRFSILCILALGACRSDPAPQEAARPSFLIILPDQLRAQALGCMGNPDIRTPHLDALAKEGLLFRNTFANTPVCCPARAVILTGRYAHANGMVANDLRLRESETTVAEILRERGYRTGFIGKWHLDGGPRLPGFVPPGPRRQGFDFWAANECSHAHFNTQYFRDGEMPIPVKKFEAEAWTDLAIEFLRESRGRPFFLVVSMGPPHDPYGAPEKFMKMYHPQTISMRPNWVEGTAGGGRKEIAAYAAAVTAVDEQVGRLSASLRELGREEDTMVLLTSDHGDMLGSQGRRLKRVPWEESIRVPGILRYPQAVKPGRTTDALFSHADIAPTMLALAGIPIPPAMQGSDLSGVVRGTAEAGPGSVFLQQFVPYRSDNVLEGWRGLRTSRHLYARTETEPWLLYDLEADPFEQRNLAADPASAPLRAELERKLAAWMARTGDAWTFNSRQPVDDKGRLYRFGTFTTVDEYLKWAAAHPELAPKD
ncbi:MAG: sulfatase [Planctomycetes bacterium]|nr:sulfatase [Planctomycetota bacterium]